MTSGEYRPGGDVPRKSLHNGHLSGGNAEKLTPARTRIATDRAAMAREINATFRIGDKLTVDIDGIPDLPYTYTDTSAVHVYVARPDGVQQCIDTAAFLAALRAGKVAKVTRVTVPLNEVTADGITRALSGKPAKLEVPVHLGAYNDKTACGRGITAKTRFTTKTAEVTCKRCKITDRFRSAVRAEERKIKLAEFESAGIRVGMVVKYIGDHESTPTGTLGMVTSLGTIGSVGLWDDRLTVSGWSFADPTGFARSWAEVTITDLVTCGQQAAYLGSAYTVTSVDEASGTVLLTSMSYPGKVRMLTASEVAAELTRGHLAVGITPAVKCESCHVARGTREFTVTGTFLGSMIPRTQGETFLLCVMCYRSAMATVDPEMGHGTVYVYWHAERVIGQPIKFDREHCTRYVCIGADQEAQHMIARTTASMVEPGYAPMITACGFDDPNHNRAYLVTRHGVDTVEYMTRGQAKGTAWEHNYAKGWKRDETFACVEIDPLSGEMIEKVW